MVRGARNGTAGAVAIAAIVVAALPWFVPPFTTFEFTYVGAYAIAILGLVILTGLSGQISLGHGAFVAAGGYTAAYLSATLNVPYWVSIPVAAVVCCVLGFVIGLVSLRLAGVYLALATFSLAVATPSILKHFKSITGGVQGLQLPALTPPGALQGVIPNERWLYYVTWLLVAAAFAFSAWLLSGRTGRALRALRDNEIAAISFGVNPYFYKTLAFGWSSALAGIAGAIIAIATAYVSPDTYAFALSITLLIGAVLGGIDTLWGALVGGIVVEFLPLWAQKISSAAPSVVYGVALIVVMMFMPGGIVGTLQRAIARRRGIPVPEPALDTHVPSIPPVAVNQPSGE